MALSMKSSRMAVRPSARSAVVVRASAQPVDRRAALGFVAVALGAALAPEAKAMKIPSQDSTGGMVTGNGSMTKSPSAATMEGYTLEGYPGTKKPSWISPGEKRELRSKARELAMKQADAGKK